MVFPLAAAALIENKLQPSLGPYKTLCMVIFLALLILKTIVKWVFPFAKACTVRPSPRINYSTLELYDWDNAPNAPSSDSFSEWDPPLWDTTQAGLALCLYFHDDSLDNPYKNVQSLHTCSTPSYVDVPHLSETPVFLLVLVLCSYSHFVCYPHTVFAPHESVTAEHTSDWWYP